MDKKNNTNYRDIRTIQDLQYQRRLLSSKIEHQEIMVMYKLNCVWEFISPSNLLDMGFRAIASHNRSFNIFYNAVSFVKNLLAKRRS